MKLVKMLISYQGLNAGEVGGYSDDVANELIIKGIAKEHIEGEVITKVIEVPEGIKPIKRTRGK